MPTPDFRQVVLTQIGQPFIPVRAYTSDRSWASSVVGNMQKYANGRYRSISQAGVGRQVTVTLRDMPTGDITVPTTPTPTVVRYWKLLEQWLGTSVLYRDYYGNFLYGTYFSITPKERKDPAYLDVALTFQELTGVVGQ